MSLSRTYSPPTHAPVRHAQYEDGLALIVGTLIISMALVLIQAGGLLTGGVAGAALLLHYASGIPFGIAFFALNLPFYVLAWMRLGWAFTVKTVVAVGLLAVLSEMTPRMLSIGNIHPAYAAVVSGVLLGMGFLVLIRHRASLGGVGILAVWLQETRGWRAGHVQMAVDCAIVLASLSVVPLPALVWSVVGVVVLNFILAMNHKPGRYVGY